MDEGHSGKSQERGFRSVRDKSTTKEDENTDKLQDWDSGDDGTLEIILYFASNIRAKSATCPTWRIYPM